MEKVELDKEKLKKELDSAKEQVAKLKHTIQTSASELYNIYAHLHA